jgi:hypothetical protein
MFELGGKDGSLEMAFIFREQICFFCAVSVSFRSFYCLRGLRVIEVNYAIICLCHLCHYAKYLGSFLYYLVRCSSYIVTIASVNLCFAISETLWGGKQMFRRVFRGLHSVEPDP